MPYDIIIGRNKSDKEKFKDKGLLYIGKGYVHMGNYTSLSNKIWLDVIRSHIILIAGKRGSGKSYNLGVLAEELSNLPSEVSSNIAPLIFDTMGIFWTMKYKNEKDIALLDDWGLKAKNLPVNVWAPLGFFNEYESRGIPVDKKFALAASELNIEDWISTFNLSMTEPISILIQEAITNLRIKDYCIQDIIEEIKRTNHEENTKRAAVSLFNAAKSWKVFANRDDIPTKISDLIEPGKTNILDISVYSSTSSFNVRALIIGLISKKLFDQRMLARKKEEIDEIHHGLADDKKEMPLVWLFIDEAHEFLPMNTKTPATNALIQILREGRQPGMSLILATQQPGVIHRDVMTQSDIIISHRLTNKNDIEALNEMMQSYLIEGITKSMNHLPDLKGSAIVLDDNSERLYPIRIRPRFTWHGGEAPKALQDE
ncbi:ATP-binding protein [Candidatus Pacearchaeota archaeon]|nr:ATP-binding protein [Candidatus Pacearchaeota archaeon]